MFHNHSVSSNVEFPAVKGSAKFCKQEVEEQSIMYYSKWPQVPVLLLAAD